MSGAEFPEKLCIIGMYILPKVVCVSLLQCLCSAQVAQASTRYQVTLVLGLSSGYSDTKCEFTLPNPCLPNSLGM